MRFDLLHPADQIVTIMRRIYAKGMTTISGGNLSIRSQEGIWITPSGIDKGALAREDIVLVKPDGSYTGRHKPSVEIPFHENVYAVRADVNAVLHAHSPALIAFSLVRRNPCVYLTPDIQPRCGQIETAPYEAPGSDMLSAGIAAAFQKGAGVVMMENHGCAVGAKDLQGAFLSFEALERTARMELFANRIGTPRKLTKEQLALARETVESTWHASASGVTGSDERVACRDLCDIAQRAYDRNLISGTQYAASIRLDAEAFLTTPTGADCMYLQPEDIVRMDCAHKEADAAQPYAVRLQRAIYRAHPEVNAIMVAQPVAAMAFAVTDAAFDSRVIPESYVMLRDLRKLPFDALHRDMEGVAGLFSKRMPVALIENRCAVVTGYTLLEAYDRLEVLEFSAHAFIDAQSIGTLSLMNAEQLKKIEIVFQMT